MTITPHATPCHATPRHATPRHTEVYNPHGQHQEGHRRLPTAQVWSAATRVASLSPPLCRDDREPPSVLCPAAGHRWSPNWAPCLRLSRDALRWAWWVSASYHWNNSITSKLLKTNSFDPFYIMTLMFAEEKSQTFYEMFGNLLQKYL